MIKIELDASVKTLNFGSHKESEDIHNSLVNKGILTVEELCRLTKAQFSKSFDMDVENIVFHLSKVGLHLGMNDKDFVQFLDDRGSLLIKNEGMKDEDNPEDNDNLTDCLVMNDYETGKQLVFTNLGEMFQYFDSYVSELKKENSEMEEVLKKIKPLMIHATERSAEIDNAVARLSEKVKTFIEMTQNEAKKTREDRIFEVAKEEFLRSKCLFRSRDSRLKKALLNAILLVDGQSYVLDSLDKEKNNSK